MHFETEDLYKIYEISADVLARDIEEIAEWLTEAERKSENEVNELVSEPFMEVTETLLKTAHKLKRLAREAGDRSFICE